MSGKKFSDAEVEWAARCLHEAACKAAPDWEAFISSWEVRSWRAATAARARHALEHGYTTPPKPVREQVAKLFRDTWSVPMLGDAWLAVADALLARFDVTPKGGNP